MKSGIVAFSILLSVSLYLHAQTADHSVSGYGWTISIDEKNNALNMPADSLGILLKDIHLFRTEPKGLRELKVWSVEAKAGNQLSIETPQPRSTWTFSLDTNILRIATSEANGVITAEAPASSDV